MLDDRCFRWIEGFRILLISGSFYVIFKTNKDSQGGFMKKVIFQGLSLLRILVILGIVSSLFWINSLISIPDSFTLNYVYIQIIVLLKVIFIL